MTSAADFKNLKHNEPLAGHTTFRVGGRAKFFFEANDIVSLKSAVLFAKSEHVPLFILGGGTNVLVSDKGFDGLVIKLNFRELNFSDDGSVLAGAGAPMGALVNKAKELGLSGLEWAAGFPGTLGGAVFGNAGALGGEIADSVRSVEVFDIRGGHLKKYSKEDGKFNYRYSVFKNSPNLVILGTLLKLHRGDVSDIAEKMVQNMKSRIDHQPLEFKSCGCVFKNINLSVSSEVRQLASEEGEFGHFENAKFLPAGFLIDKAGLKGLRVGGAVVSEKHGNFILNKDGATAGDIFRLIQLVKEKVFRRYGVRLEEEVRFLGEFF